MNYTVCLIIRTALIDTHGIRTVLNPIPKIIPNIQLPLPWMLDCRVDSCIWGVRMKKNFSVSIYRLATIVMFSISQKSLALMLRWEIPAIQTLKLF